VASKLEIDVEEKDGVSVVRISGPVDSATVESFRTRLGPLFKVRGAHIVMDFTELTYINSSGLGEMMQFRRVCYVGGGRVALFGVSSRIMRGLEMLKLDKQLKICDTLEEALVGMA